MKKLLLSIAIAIIFAQVPAFAQETGTIEIQIKDWNGEPIEPFGTELTILQNNIPVLTTHLESNPQKITEVLFGENYSFKLIRDGMLIESAQKLTLNSPLEKVDLRIPPQGGLKFNVYYNDGYTPIPDADFEIFSHQDKKIVEGNVIEGQTKRFWLQANNENEFYKAQISLGNELVFIQSPIKSSPDVITDFKIVTQWPSVIDKRIIAKIYQIPEVQITIELVDSNENKIAESQLNSRGEAYFSNIAVGEYFFRAVEKENSEVWGLSRVSLDGSKNLVEIVQNPEVESCNCVAFRFDDVQDYFLGDVQKGVIQMFNEKNAPLTIGVIGGLIGDDSNIVDAINEDLSSPDSQLEVANHSWNNSPLTTMSKEKQNSVIKNTNQEIFETFGVTPTVFIPPENKFNSESLEVLKENDFTHMSSSFNHDEPPYPLIGSTLYQFPQGAQTAVLDADSNLWITEDITKIYNDISISMKEYGFAVVMMHPPDFAQDDDGIYRNLADEQKIEQLSLLLDKIRQEGFEIVPISMINFDAPNSEKRLMVSKNSCNCISFTVEGIQDYWLNNVQNELIKTFEETKTPVTVGIVGNHFGEDEVIVSYLDSAISNNSFDIDIANNGWNYERFEELGLKEQRDLLTMGNSHLSNVLGVQPVTFLAPYDSVNEVTILAMQQNSMNIISVNKIVHPPPYDFTKGFYLVPYGASTSQYDPQLESMKGKIHEETFAEIQNEIQENGFAVVRLSPLEFAVNSQGDLQNIVLESQIDELEKLLTKINQEGIKTVPITKIPHLLNGQAILIPEWIKNNALWWSNNQIADSEFTTSIEYLIKNKIIIIPQVKSSGENLEKHVPEWIKNNAKWWAEGKISDADFVGGIEFLIKNGVIQV